MTKHKYLSNFDYFSFCLMSFLAHWIVTTSKKKIFKPKENYAKNISWNWLDFQIFEIIEL
jgi:hypothetical protein